MTQAKHDIGQVSPPSIRDLTVSFLKRNEEAEGVFSALAFGEVELHEVSVAFRIEPRQAWHDGLRALKAFGHTSSISAPAAWAEIVARQTPVAAVPFAAGNHPQRVRDLNALLQNEDLIRLRPEHAESSAASNGLKNWAAQQIRKGDPHLVMVVAGALRAAGDLDAAAAALAELRSRTPPVEQPAIANEEAALLWDRGEWEKAVAIWQSLPESVPVLFNRGMADLFLGRSEEARNSLRKAIADLSEDDPWHHIASLYLALAE